LRLVTRWKHPKFMKHGLTTGRGQWPTRSQWS